MTTRTHQKSLPGFVVAVLRTLRIFAIAYLVVMLLLMIFEESFIYFPYPYDGSDDWRPRGLVYQDVFFESEDGTRLHAWYCPAQSPRAVILFAHGNAGNLAHRVDLARLLQRNDITVMMFDYRGYGRSDGSPSEVGILADARAARLKLAELAGVTVHDVVLMGRSLGGGVAVDLAAEDGARGLIVESTFTSLPDVAAVHYPFLPVRILMRNRLVSVEKIGKYQGPFLQSHGDRDRTIPIDLGRRLHEAAEMPDGVFKQFFVIEGGDHNDPQPPAYYNLLDEFIDSLE